MERNSGLIIVQAIANKMYSQTFNRLTTLSWYHANDRRASGFQVRFPDKMSFNHKVRLDLIYLDRRPVLQIVDFARNSELPSFQTVRMSILYEITSLLSSLQSMWSISNRFLYTMDLYLFPRNGKAHVRVLILASYILERNLKPLWDLLKRTFQLSGQFKKIYSRISILTCRSSSSLVCQSKEIILQGPKIMFHPCFSLGFFRKFRP